MQAAPEPPPDGVATMSLVFGALAVTCAGALCAVPAIVLGLIARRDIAKGRAPKSGAPRAAGGILLGFVGMALTVVALSVFAVPTAEPRAHEDVPASAGARAALEVVDVSAARPLSTQLREIARDAPGRTLILQTSVRGSSECDALARAFRDARMKVALAGITIVRVDLGAFERELQALRVETASAPWFYRFDADLRWLDAISASEWDENVPERMAPVLRAFAAGRLQVRRAPPPAGVAR